MDETLKRIVNLIGPKRGAAKELAEYLGFNPNVITNWKNGRNKSYMRYLPEIAEFYGTTVEYLEGKTNEKRPRAQTEGRKIEDILAEARSQLESEKGLMFDGGVASQEAIDSIIAAMEIGLEVAMKKAKEERERSQRLKQEIIDAVNRKMNGDEH